MLQTITTSIATRASHQFVVQLFMAVDESVRPIAIMIGPVTMGGKKRITFFVPKALKRPDNMTYMRPAAATPIHA